MTETFGQHLRRLRQDQNLSLRQLSALSFIDFGQLSKVENGRRKPSTILATAIDQALSANGALIAHAETERPRLPESPANIANANGAQQRRTVAIDTRPLRQLDPTNAVLDLQGEKVQRRTLLGDIAALGIATPFLGLETLRHDLHSLLDDEPQDLAEWEAITWDYGCNYATTPPTTLLQDLTTDLAIADSQLRRLARGSAEWRDMCRVLARLGVFLAQTIGNLGSMNASRRWWRFARHAADASGDPELRVWVRGREVIRGLYDHRPLEAVIELADEALAISRNPGMGTGSAMIGRAQALAALGRTREASEAIQAVYEVVDRLPTRVTGDTASMYGWPEYRLRHGESFVYTYIGDAVRAEEAQNQAITLYPTQMYRELTQVRLHEAMRLITLGEPLAGVEHAVTALALLPPSQHIEVVLELARAVARAVPTSEQTRPRMIELREILAAPQALTAR
jgi:transcriptional regulator with XRE-family HTH domain